MHTDPDRQPGPSYNAARRLDRGIHELLGLAKGVLADGKITDDEALAIKHWVRANAELVDLWPVNVLAGRLNRIFEDLRVDDDEREDLAELLRRIVGGGFGVIAGQNMASDLPLDAPPPAVTFNQRVYVFTGRFAFGPRRACEHVTRQLGGQCESQITLRTNYLVVGTFGSRDWAHTSFGRKIQLAIEYRDLKSVPLAIISEDHWASVVP